MGITVSRASSATVSFSTPQEIVINHADDSIKIGDGTDLLAINPDGNLNSMKVSSVNSSTATLASGATFTGTWEDVSGYNTVTTALKTDQDGTLYMEFSPDGSNTDSTLSFGVSAGVNEFHRLTITRKYFRMKYTNTAGSSQTYFRAQSIIGNQPLLSAPMNLGLSTDSDAIVTKAVLFGKQDNERYTEIHADASGHTEVAIHGPLNPFGSIQTAQLTPVFQHDFVYGINPNNVLATINASGTATASDACGVVTTGTTIYGAGSITSNNRAIYRAGQGIVGRFTASFTSPVASSYQIAGFGNPEDGFYVGAVGASNGILFGNRGVRECQTLTITTKSSTAENATVTLNGTAYSVAVTNGASTITTAYEISKGNYGSAWRAEAIGSTVRFLSSSVGNKTGSFSIAGTSVVGSFAETLAGVALTENFVAQASFNMDTLDGSLSTSNPSGMQIDWTKLNVFQLHIQYLGVGAITWYVEHAPEGNNPTWVPFHTYAFPNTLTTTSIRNPTFQYQMSAYSAGSTTNLTVKSGSFAAFIEGEKKNHGDRYSYINTSTGVGAASYLPLFTIRNGGMLGGITNQSVIKVLSIFAAIKHTSPVVIYLFRNATLTGSPNFAAYSSTSCSYLDTAATACTITSNDQLLWSGPIGDTGNISFEFTEEIRILPFDTITVAARSVTGTPSYVTASLNTKEFQ